MGGGRIGLVEAARAVGGSGDVRALTVQEGRVELGGRCPIADDWFHVDASDAASLVTVLAWQNGQLVLRILPSGVNIVLR